MQQVFRNIRKLTIWTLCTCIFTTHTLSIIAPFGKSNRKNCRRNGLGTCKGQRWHDSISSRTDGWALRWNWAFRLEKNVYKWCFWWLVAHGAPCKPNWDFRTILLGFPCRQLPQCYFKLEGSKEVFGQQRWFHLLCANCYVVCTEWKDDNWLDLN